jgi:conjugal transfer pilus assembly protein TraU
MTRSTFQIVRRCLASLALFALLTHAHAQQCKGRFPNPVTDICWSCTFPMKLGSVPIGTFGQEDNGTSGGMACSCSSGVTINIGANLSFWEPTRIAEFVRDPYCFPMLGGTKLPLPFQAPSHSISADEHKDPPGSFYQGHWYANPILFYLETILDNSCLERNVFDMTYMTELDPLWADTDATFILNPDAVLFTGFASKVAAAYDCVQASVGMPVDEIFWSAGCQGHMYPLNGFVSAHVSGIQASALLMQRLTNKLHREGLMWGASGSEGRCGYYIEPIMKKSNYKYQMLWPSRQTEKIEGRCCQPYGRTTQLWQIGRQYPFGGEDFAYQIFRKRDCCSSMSAAGFGP